MKFLHNFAFFAALTLTTAAQPFTFTNFTDKSIALFDGACPVFIYNHGLIHKPGVPADRARSSYIHPLYDLDGEILTDDFPKDHYHHRGVFWAWPHVRIGDQHHDLWMLKGIEHRFQKWIVREATSKGATLQLENGWFVGDRKVMREAIFIRASPASDNARALDIELAWTPIDQPIVLEGAEDKSYGGLTIRFAPRANTVVTTPLGQGEKDLTMTRLPWADLSGRFDHSQNSSGAAIFVASDHPSFPPEWLTRHYGALCLGWPGIKPKTLQPGETVRCRYRIWIHRGAPTVQQLSQQYDQFAAPTSGAALLKRSP
jgi:hypothetical protein